MPGRFLYIPTEKLRSGRRAPARAAPACRPRPAGLRSLLGVRAEGGPGGTRDRPKRGSRNRRLGAPGPGADRAAVPAAARATDAGANPRLRLVSRRRREHGETRTAESGDGARPLLAVGAAPRPLRRLSEEASKVGWIWRRSAGRNSVLCIAAYASHASSAPAQRSCRPTASAIGPCRPRRGALRRPKPPCGRFLAAGGPRRARSGADWLFWPAGQLRAVPTPPRRARPACGDARVTGLPAPSRRRRRRVSSREAPSGPGAEPDGDHPHHGRRAPGTRTSRKERAQRGPAGPRRPRQRPSRSRTAGDAVTGPMARRGR